MNINLDLVYVPKQYDKQLYKRVSSDCPITETECQS